MDAGADMQPRRRGASCFACGPVLHKPPETPNCGQTSGGSQFVDPAAGQCVPCFGARSPNLRAHRRWIPGLACIGSGPLVSRSEERRVGKECVSTCRSRWSPYYEKKKTKDKQYKT